MINAKSKLLNPYYQRNPIKLDKVDMYNIDFCSVVPATASRPDPLWEMSCPVVTLPLQQSW